MSSVYLAGPIAGLAYDDATDWRNEAIEEIVGLGYEVFSPMREKSELREVYKGKVLDPTADLDMGGPFGRDIFDIDRSDVVLANLIAMDTPSIGTMFELGYAYKGGKFILVVMEPWQDLPAPRAGDKGYHPFIQGAATKGAVVHSLNAAYRVLRAIQPISPGRVSQAGQVVVPELSAGWEEDGIESAPYQIG